MRHIFQGLYTLCGLLNMIWFSFIGYAMFQRDGWIAIFNPYFDTMVLFYWITTPLTWILLAGFVVFFYAHNGAQPEERL